MIYKLLRPLLFVLNLEQIRKFILASLSVLYKFKLIRPLLSQTGAIEVMGIKFPNRVGLAAGFDKNATCIEPLFALGFGAIEIGTVTPSAQFSHNNSLGQQLPKIEALIDGQKFANDGVEQVRFRLAKAKISGVLGINIGKNLTTRLSRSLLEYQYCMQRLYQFAGYFSINFLQDTGKGMFDLLQEPQGALPIWDNLLIGIKAFQAELTEKHGRYVPIVMKIPINLAGEILTPLLSLLIKHKIDGVIVTYADKGLCGLPINLQAERALATIATSLRGKMPLISVGGVSTAEDLRRRLRLGADLVQIYSGLIYKGPRLLTELSSSSG